MKDSIKSMVNKFLSWKLPTNFYPDAGISFTPKYNVGTPYERNHEPIGTNLFDADQARQMFEYCCAEELTKSEAAARQQGFEEGKQAGRDEVLNKQRVWCEVHGYGCGCNESTCSPRPNKPTKE